MTLANTDISEIGTKLDEIESQNNLAKEEIIDTIKLSEIDVCKGIKSLDKDLKEDNVSTRQLVRQKAKKQEEFIQKQLDSEAKTQKMIEYEADELEEEIEQLYEYEADDMENELQSIYAKEYDQIEKETNQSNNDNT